MKLNQNMILILDIFPSLLRAHTQYNINLLKDHYSRNPTIVLLEGDCSTPLSTIDSYDIFPSPCIPVSISRIVTVHPRSDKNLGSVTPQKVAVVVIAQCLINKHHIRISYFQFENQIS